MIGMASQKSTAQETYLLKDLSVPQIVQENPALVHPYYGHCGFPLLGRFNVGFNSYVNLEQIWHINNNFDKYAKKINPLAAWMNVSVIDFGFRIKESNYITVFSNFKFDAGINLTKDFNTFLLHGNADYAGKTLKLLADNFLNINAYAEIGLGYQREINENISFGVNFKYIAGLVNLHTSKAQADLRTGNLYDQLYVDHTLQAKLSSSVNIFDLISGNADLNINNIFNNLNHGFGVDVGFRYRINDWVELDVAALDIGLINWKKNAYSYDVKNRVFDFTGMNHDDVFQDSGKGLKDDILNPDKFLNALVDSIQEELLGDTMRIDGYKKWLNTRFNIGMYFYASPKDRFNLTFNGEFNSGKLIPSGSVSYHRQCGRWFEFVIGNTFKMHHWLNPGLGFNLKSDYFLFYCLVDYINHPVYIDKMRNVNVVLGINFLAGRRDKNQKLTPSFSL
jgi:hypothetical protein